MTLLRKLIMKPWSRNIIIGLLSLLVLISTSGFNLFIHHCNCSDDESITILVEKHSECCNLDDESSCCSTIDESHSCYSDHIDGINNTCDSGIDCCKIIKKYVYIFKNKK